VAASGKIEVVARQRGNWCRKIEEAIMATDSRRGTPDIAESVPDQPSQPAGSEHDVPLASPVSKEREAEIKRIVSQRNLPLIEEGVEAYKRDLPQLLSENRYRQLVAYRGSELVAFGSTHRQLRRRLEKKGFTNRGELFIISVAPLEIDEDEALEP
jgi:hypothetical protein